MEVYMYLPTLRTFVLWGNNGQRGNWGVHKKRTQKQRLNVSISFACSMIKEGTLIEIDMPDKEKENFLHVWPKLTIKLYIG